METPFTSILLSAPDRDTECDELLKMLESYGKRVLPVENLEDFYDFYQKKTPQSLLFDYVLRDFHTFLVVPSPELARDKALRFFLGMILTEVMYERKRILPIAFSKEDEENTDLYSLRQLVHVQMYTSTDDPLSKRKRIEEQVQRLFRALNKE